MVYTRNLKAMEIIAEIIENDTNDIDFCKGWTEREIADYLKSNYPCSNYCAKQAASYLSSGIIPDKAIDIKCREKKPYLK